MVLGVCVAVVAGTLVDGPRAKSGLVAAYGFDEGTGTVVTDSSGNGNTGTIAGATWTTAGKYGVGALSFNGTTARVTVPDAPSLDLTDALTLEAWVLPDRRPVELARHHRQRRRPLLPDGRLQYRTGRRLAARSAQSIRTYPCADRPPGEYLDASGRHLRPHDGAALRQWGPGSQPARRRRRCPPQMRC